MFDPNIEKTRLCIDAEDTYGQFHSGNNEAAFYTVGFKFGLNPALHSIHASREAWEQGRIDGEGTRILIEETYPLIDDEGDI